MSDTIAPLRGGRAAAERAVAAKAARDKQRSSSFNTWEYLRLAAAPEGQVYGESKVIRMVTDESDWIEALQHSFVNTKQPPADMPDERKAKWPKKMGAVCRYTLGVVGTDSDGNPILREWFDNCVIDDLHLAKGQGKNGEYDKKASPRLWAVAVEREEILGTQEMVDAGEIEPYQVGDAVGYRDMYVDHTDKDGNTTQIKKFLVLNFANENFFDHLLGNFNVFKTVLDRDYKITRKGSGTDTGYSITPLDPITVDVDGKQVRLDLRRPEFAKEYEPPFDLFEIVREQASDEHYEWFFDPNVESSYEKRFGKRDKSESAPSESKPAKTEASPAEEEQARQNLDGIRQRLQAKSKAQSNA